MLSNELSSASTVIVTHYQGIDVENMNILRKKMHQLNAKFIVTKNRLAKIAIKDTNFAKLENLLKGPTAVAISKDPVAAAKAIMDFSENNENLKILGGVANDNVLNEQQIKALASLPSMDELRAKIIALIQTPATNLVRVVKAPASQMARVVSAYSSKGN